MSAALPQPAQVFDLSGRSAVVTGATGAFGEQAAYALAGGRCRRHTGRRQRGEAGGRGRGHPRWRRSGRPPRRCAPRPRRTWTGSWATAVDAGGGLDIVVAGSGTNIPGAIVEQDPADWDTVMDVNVRQSWLLCRAAGRVMIAAGPRRQGDPDVVHPRSARAGQLHRLLPVEGRGRPADQGAGRRVGPARHQRQRHRSDRVPLGPHRLDVRRRGQRPGGAGEHAAPHPARSPRRADGLPRRRAVPRQLGGRTS